MRLAPFSNDKQAGKLLAADLERELVQARTERDALAAKVDVLTIANLSLRQQNEWMKTSYELDDRTIAAGVSEMAAEQDLKQAFECQLHDLRAQIDASLRENAKLRMYLIALIVLFMGVISLQYSRLWLP